MKPIKYVGTYEAELQGHEKPWKPGETREVHQVEYARLIQSPLFRNAAQPKSKQRPGANK